jgi:hypothetical protein
VRLDEMEREGVVAGGHRRMCGEDGGAPHVLERRLEGPAALAVIADALQHYESGVPFVEVVDRRI